MAARIDVVGLGPAGADLITAGTGALIAEIQHRWVRTHRHPAAHVVAGQSMDHHYEVHDSFDDVYEAIVAELLEAAHRHERVLYAVPGSPRVAERTVEMLAEASGTDVVVHPALSFIDLAWVALGVDPIDEGVTIIDGHRFAAEAAGHGGPLLVAQCHSRDVLSAIKLAVDDPGDAQVVVLQRLGAVDQAVYEIDWYELDRAVEPDHLTSIYIPRLGEPVAAAFQQFDEMTRRLRADCPWDAEQTHASLRRYLLEEAYETLEALDNLAAALDEPAADEVVDDRYDDLEEELGDLLYQIFFHAILATEQGRFTVADVARGIHDKLYERHPHVYGDVDATLEELPAQWEAAKRDEKGRGSVMDGIPAALPALLYASKVQKKAAAVDQYRPGPQITASDFTGELGEDRLGALLFAVVELARTSGIDAESALRQHALQVADEVRQNGS